MKNKKAFFIFLAIFPSIAFANVAIPVVMVLWPQMLITLLAIVILECVVYSRALQRPWRPMVKAVLKANLLTLFVGLPLASFIQLIFTAFAHEVAPLRIGAEISSPYVAVFRGIVNGVMIGGGTWGKLFGLFSLLGCYLFSFGISCWFESLYLRNNLIVESDKLLKKLVLKAHVLSYGFLMVLTWTMIYYSDIKSQIIRLGIKIYRWYYFKF